jgi:Subtilase family./Peptidase inhibitor I9.
MVELEGEPAVEAWIRGRAESSRSALAVAAASNRVAELRVAQARVEELLTAPAIGARVQYRVTRVYNGIAVFAEPSRVEAIRALPGVKSVRPLVLHTTANATSVPHLGVPLGVWQALANAGDDVKVGVIDSGLDYQHAMFGGAGRESDYKANDRTKINDGFFPTARVVGGWDFAGDDYGGGGAATPDPDPMDCGGHGTHVAGASAAPASAPTGRRSRDRTTAASPSGRCGSDPASRPARSSTRSASSAARARPGSRRRRSTGRWTRTTTATSPTGSTC